jgi:uncharacterized protein (TIGR02099 family)
VRFIVSRLVRTLLWLLVSFFILLAILVTALRVALPHMNRFQDSITQWVNQQTEMHLSVSDVQGFWRNAHPSISLKGLKATLPEGTQITLDADSVDLEFDLLKSLLQCQPVVSYMVIHNLNLDMSSVDLLALKASDATFGASKTEDSQIKTLRSLDNVFLKQLDNFSILNSTVRYRSFRGNIHQLKINTLKWRNNGNHHRLQGVVSVADTGINSLSVRAEFDHFDSFRDISGQFYVSSENVSIGPWLTRYLKNETGIQSGKMSFNAWLTLQHGKPTEGYVRLKPSDLYWIEQQKHHLHIDGGGFSLIPGKDGLLVRGESLAIQTDKIPWPKLNFIMNWQPTGWQMNVDQIRLKPLVPMVRRMPMSDRLKQLLDDLNPDGTLQDIRLSHDQHGYQYSAHLSDGAVSQWYLLPEVRHLQARIAGNSKKAVIRAELVDERLPYGDVFQAPLNIRRGKVNLVWQSTPDGWSLWSDRLSIQTPDLKTIGAFRLDVHRGQSPFLSFYDETDIDKAEEIWRYLPTRALGRDLTDYLSRAIQGGRAQTAKLVWYGKLDDYPYDNNNGIFQAFVSLKNARFRPDTAWPPLTNLQLRLLFQNEALHFESDTAHLMAIKAKHVTGRIPRLVSSGHIEIEASAEAKGNDVRDFMTATPLVDSVGAALTAVKIKGNVTSEFQLRIPLQKAKKERVWGWVDLKKNQVRIRSPEIDLKDVSGRLHFDNDVVNAKSMKGQWLGQPVVFAFNGKNNKNRYDVHIDTQANWKVAPLAYYAGKRWIDPLSGRAPWKMGIDLQLDDVGFSYQINLNADLKNVGSRYPHPLDKQINQPGQAVLQVSGNQETINARLQVPQGKYQAKIDISQPEPVLTASNLVLGKGSFKVSPIVGHSLSVRLEHFNLDQWLKLMTGDDGHKAKQPARQTTLQMPAIPPRPDHIKIQVKDLTLATLEWHDVDFLARHNARGWEATLKSQESQGKADYPASGDQVNISLDHLHLYVPSLEKKDNGSLFVDEDHPEDSEITLFDRRFHQEVPNLTLKINDFWFQGYKVGRFNMALQRQGKALLWKNIDIVSGTNEVHANGQWLLDGQRSHTQLNMDFKGDNNSDLMERFGITSGIQNAPFSISSHLNWDGAPWSMQVNTLQGELKTKLGKGMVSDVSGAARLLGLFSLDSIIRKMQLDFSDVFDKGMAFNSIEGSGTIKKGIFVTNNLKMDAVAGNMTIKGLVDLDNQTVDAEVNFVPDITSGIPVLSAFAVAPQTALYVLAITTVISPVVEVFTEVNYEIKGPIENPTVKEISRSKGEFKLPEKFRQEVKQDQMKTQGKK